MQAHIYKELMISWGVYQASVTMYLSDPDSDDYQKYQEEMGELKATLNATLKQKFKDVKPMKRDDRNE